MDQTNTSQETPAVPVEEKVQQVAESDKIAPITAIKFQPASETKTTNLISVIIFVSLLQIYEVESGKLLRSISLAGDSPQNELSSEHLVHDACFSHDGTKFAVVLDNKILRVFECENWTVLFENTLVKRPTAIDLTHKGDEVCVADKFGDAYRFCLDGSNKESEPIVGHVSLLTNILVTPDDRFILTSDRDEKVRVSCYPNGYNIHTYCLGHREFVSSICIPKQPLLISGGGDPYILVSDYVQGKKLAQLALPESSTPTAVAEIQTVANCEEPWVVVRIENASSLLIYQVLASGTVNFHQALELPSPPTSFGFSSPSSLYVAVASAPQLHHFELDQSQKFVPALSSSLLSKSVTEAGTFKAPNGLSVVARENYRKLRAGAPDDYKLGNNGRRDEDSSHSCDEAEEEPKKQKLE